MTRTAPPTLLVVESPAKALTLRRWLGSGWEVRATGGHLFDLPRSREGIDLAHGFEPAWELVRGQARALSDLKRAARRSGRVLLATDPDREGEAIAWQLAAELQPRGAPRPIQRLVLGELTEEATWRALAHPVELDPRRAEAQVARRVLDRLIGFRLSARLSAAIRPGLAAGRVQAAALRLAAAWEPAAGGAGPARPAPPPPFTTGTLLLEAARRLRFRPARTMRLAQRLYEGVALGDGGRTGLITYPRTGSERVAGAADRAARALVAASGRPAGPGPAAIGGTPEGPVAGHEAIRPASLELAPASVAEALRAAGGRDLARLYALVWERFLESRGAPPASRRSPARPRPDRLDDAGLLEALLARGVGRPSTLAAIGDSLEARGYLDRAGGALRVTPVGRRVVGWLDRAFPATLDAGYTAALELRLDEVEAGRVGWREAVAEAWSPLEAALSRLVA